LNEVIPMPKAKPKRAAPRAMLESGAVLPVVNGLLLEPEVMTTCRLSRSQIWKLEQADRFPKRKKYGFRRIAWPAADIQKWLTIGADGWLAEHGSSAAA
jgi:predicted DNA-binding transcriptional regulator AlpA